MFKTLIFSIWMATALNACPIPNTEVSFWSEYQTGARVREFVQSNPEAYREVDYYVSDWFYNLVSPVMGWE